MEVMEFIKQKVRMCDYYDYECTRKCSNEICPAHDVDCNISTNMTECLVEIVEKWAKEHPDETEQESEKPEHNEELSDLHAIIDSLEDRIDNLEKKVLDKYPVESINEPKRTNKDVLLAAFPDARMNNNGIPEVCPLSLDKHYDCYKFTDCEECRCLHWNTEVEE